MKKYDVVKEYDVVIVGCGPVGVTAANLLGHHGISTLVIERDLEPYDLPRAVHIDHEIMRIFQSIGLAESLLPQFVMPVGSMHFGADRSVIRPYRPIVQTERTGWASDYFFYQPDLERALRRELQARASVDLAWGHSLASIKQDEFGVEVTAQRNGEVLRARGKYLFACDGAKSTVRKTLDIELNDLGFDEPWIVVDVLVDGPVTMPALHGAPPNVDMQQVMFIIGDPARPTSVIPGVGKHRRWEFMLLPSETPEDFNQPKAIEALLAPWLGGQSYQVVRSAVYRFHALLADRWRADRVFLLGDAAHQTPPFFGQGLCHGIRDAANLSWKVKLVLDGAASEDLLESYQEERLPQVRSVIETSMRTGRYICTLDPEAAARRDAEMRQASLVPAPAEREIIPALGAGVLSPRGLGKAPVGSRFIQPPMVDALGERRLLDDFTGGGFALLVMADLADSDRIDVAALYAGLPVKLFHVLEPQGCVPTGSRELVDCSGEMHRWFERHHCKGVLVRPDFYVYGVLSTLDDISSLLHSLGVQLQLKESTVDESH